MHIRIFSCIVFTIGISIHETNQPWYIRVEGRHIFIKTLSPEYRKTLRQGYETFKMPKRTIKYVLRDYNNNQRNKTDVSTHIMQYWYQIANTIIYFRHPMNYTEWIVKIMKNTQNPFRGVSYEKYANVIESQHKKHLSVK